MPVVQMVKGEKEKVCCLLGIMEMIGVSRLQGDCSLFQKCCSISVSLFLDVSVCMCVLIPMDEYVCPCQGKCADQSAAGGIPCTLFETRFSCFSDEYARLAGLHVQGVSCLHFPSFVGVLRLLATRAFKFS